MDATEYIRVKFVRVSAVSYSLAVDVIYMHDAFDIILIRNLLDVGQIQV